MQLSWVSSWVAMLPSSEFYELYFTPVSSIMSMVKYGAYESALGLSVFGMEWRLLPSASCCLLTSMGPIHKRPYHFFLPPQFMNFVRRAS